MSWLGILPCGSSHTLHSLLATVPVHEDCHFGFALNRLLHVIGLSDCEFCSLQKRQGVLLRLSSLAEAVYQLILLLLPFH